MALLGIGAHRMRTVAFSCERLLGHLQRATLRSQPRNPRVGAVEKRAAAQSARPVIGSTAEPEPYTIRMRRGSSALALAGSGDDVVNVELEQAP